MVTGPLLDWHDLQVQIYGGHVDVHLATPWPQQNGRRAIPRRRMIGWLLPRYSISNVAPFRR